MTGYKLKYILKVTRKGSAHHIVLLVCETYILQIRITHLFKCDDKSELQFTDQLINTVALTVNVGHVD